MKITNNNIFGIRNVMYKSMFQWYLRWSIVTTGPERRQIGSVEVVSRFIIHQIPIGPNSQFGIPQNLIDGRTPYYCLGVVLFRHQLITEQSMHLGQHYVVHVDERIQIDGDNVARADVAHVTCVSDSDDAQLLRMIEITAITFIVAFLVYDVPAWTEIPSGLGARFRVNIELLSLDDVFHLAGGVVVLFVRFRTRAIDLNTESAESMTFDVNGAVLQPELPNNHERFIYETSFGFDEIWTWNEKCAVQFFLQDVDVVI